MKKLIMIAATVAAAAAFAVGFSTTEFKTRIVTPPVAIASGTATTNAVDVAGFVGFGEIVAQYSAATTNCIFKATLEGTNTVDGGWSTINSMQAVGSTRGVIRLPLASIYLPPTIRVILDAAETNATASAILISR